MPEEYDDEEEYAEDYDEYGKISTRETNETGGKGGGTRGSLVTENVPKVTGGEVSRKDVGSGKQGKGTKTAPGSSSGKTGGKSVQAKPSKVAKAKGSDGSVISKQRDRNPTKSSGDFSHDDEDAYYTYQNTVKILDGVRFDTVEEPLKWRLENEFHESLKQPIINTVVHIEKFSKVRETSTIRFFPSWLPKKIIHRLKVASTILMTMFNCMPATP
jgi:hypothetical protein